MKKNRNRYQETLHRSKTMRHIAKFIYEQSGCINCSKQEFCSRDGDKWGCNTSYQMMAEHLNSIGHLTSRGNNWSNKTVSRQFEYVSKQVTEKEKKELIRKQNEQRNAQTFWTKNIVHGVTDDDVINSFEGADTQIDNLDLSKLSSEDDIDKMTSELNKQLKLHLHNKHLLKVIVIKSQS